MDQDMRTLAKMATDHQRPNPEAHPEGLAYTVEEKDTWNMCLRDMPDT
jgi:hypothetical protein